MKSILYPRVKEQWDNDFKAEIFRYGDGYKIKNERFALIHFRTEIKQIKKILRCTAARNTFLDIGCENGKYSFNFSKIFEEVVGIDFAAYSLKIAQQEAKKRNISNCTFRCADIKNFKTKKIDVIFVGGVLMYINDRDLPVVLKNINNQLNDNGRIILREPLMRSKSLIKNEEYHVIYRSMQVLKEALRREGLKIVHQELNKGYTYGIIVDFYKKVLKIFLTEKMADQIMYQYLARPWFLNLNNSLLKKRIQSKGYFLTVSKIRKI